MEAVEAEEQASISRSDTNTSTSSTSTSTSSPSKLKNFLRPFARELGILFQATIIMNIMIFVDAFIVLGLVRIIFILYVIGILLWGTTVTSKDPNDPHVHIMNFKDLLTRFFVDLTLTIFVFEGLSRAVDHFSTVDKQRVWHGYVWPGEVEVRRAPGILATWLMVSAVFLLLSALYRAILLASVITFRTFANLCSSITESTTT